MAVHLYCWKQAQIQEIDGPSDVCDQPRPQPTSTGILAAPRHNRRSRKSDDGQSQRDCHPRPPSDGCNQPKPTPTVPHILAFPSRHHCGPRKSDDQQSREDCDPRPPSHGCNQPKPRPTVPDILAATSRHNCGPPKSDDQQSRKDCDPRPLSHGCKQPKPTPTVPHILAATSRHNCEPRKSDDQQSRKDCDPRPLSHGCKQPKPTPTVPDILAATSLHNCGPRKSDDQQSRKDCDPRPLSYGCKQPKPTLTVPDILAAPRHNHQPRKSDDVQSQKDCDPSPPSTQFKRRKENPDKENCSPFLNLDHNKCPGTCSVCPSTTTGVACPSQPERSVHCVRVPNLNDVNTNEGWGLFSPSRSSSPLSPEELQLHDLGTEKASKVLGRSPLRSVHSSKMRYLSPRAQAEDCPKQKPNNKGTEQRAIMLQTKLNRLSPDGGPSRWRMERSSCGSGRVSIKTGDDKSRPTQGNGRSQQLCAKRFDRSRDLGSTNIEQIKYSGRKKTGFESPRSNPYDHEKSVSGGSNLGCSFLDDSSSVSLSEWLQDSLNLKVGADMISESRSRSPLDSHEENCSEESDWLGRDLNQTFSGAWVQSSPKLPPNDTLTRKRHGPRDESHSPVPKCRRTEANQEKARGEATSFGAFEFPTVDLLNDNCAMPSSTDTLKHALASFAKLNLRPFWLEGRLCDKLYVVVLQKFVNNIARYYESLDRETQKDITSFIEEQRGSMINYLLKVCVGKYLS